MEKEETARVEKYAQAHLDKTQTVAAGATKVAVAWLIALALLWNEKLEPKLAEVQQAQATRHDLAVANANLINSAALSRRLQGQYDDSKNQEINLPFSIKITLAPQFVPTLWLGLALGLVWYLIFTRRQIFSLAIRGLRLFRLEAKSEPRYTTRVVGNAVWWLPPLPSGSNTELSTEDLQQTLGFESSTIRVASLFCILFSIALVLLELRVFYIGMVITSFLVGLPPNSPPNISKWFLLSALDAALCCGFFLAIVSWFIPGSIADVTDYSGSRLLERRKVLRLALGGIGTICGSVVALGSATYAFAGAWKGNGGRSKGESNRKRFRRKKSAKLSVKLPQGLYENKNTGTIHTATPSCIACLSGVNAKNLFRISPADVTWVAGKVRVMSLPPENVTHSEVL